MKRTHEAFSDTGKGNAAAAVVPSQLYLAHSWGGACARGAVRSGAVVRLLQGQFAHGSTWGGEGGKTSSPLGDRSGVFHAWYWTEDLVRSVMCCYQGGQLLDATSGAMDGRGTCYLLGCAGE